MRHKPAGRQAFSVRTVTDNKSHVCWHIQKKKPSTLQFPHQKDCSCFLRFKPDLCFPTRLFVFCLITAFTVYQIFLSEGFSGCQQLGSSASRQTMPEFRGEPRIPACRLGKRLGLLQRWFQSSVPGEQPPSVPFPAPPLHPSSQFGLQLGSLLTKYSEDKSTRGGPKWKAKNHRAVENTVMPELHSLYLVLLLLETAAEQQHDARRFLVVK